jgi:hypothetical protein
MGTATRIWDEQAWNRGSILGRGKNDSILERLQTEHRGHLASNRTPSGDKAAGVWS